MRTNENKKVIGKEVTVRQGKDELKKNGKEREDRIERLNKLGYGWRERVKGETKGEGGRQEGEKRTRGEGIQECLGKGWKEKVGSGREWGFKVRKLIEGREERKSMKREEGGYFRGRS